jgi:hypothetical protein
VSVVVRMDDGYEMVVKENDDGGWSSDSVVLWLGGEKIEKWLSGGKNGQS